MQTDYGVDVATRRADDLDRKMIAYITEKGQSHVLDIGSGAGGHSLRLAQVGAQVTALDVYDYTEAFQVLRLDHGLHEESLQFIQGDLIHLDALLGDETFDDCSMQRVLHYLPYDKAVQVLTQLRQRVSGRLYISVTGLETAIGAHYRDTSQPIESRFSRLESADAETFSIHQPLCLYTQSEFETVLKKTGWDIQGCWVSAFGNIKAVCT